LEHAPKVSKMPKERSKKVIRVLPVFRIYCEGEKTEPNYIRAYLDENHESNRTIKIVEVRDIKQNTPVQIIERAVSEKSQSDVLKDDVFWGVYDREAIAKYSNSLHKEAMDLAGKNKIKIAFSNVCFEFWILLHFTSCTKSFAKCDDVIGSKEFKDALKSIGIKSYSKSSHEVSCLVVAGHKTAARHAENINAQAIASAPASVLEGELYKLAPYTDVFKLLKAIDSFFIAHKKALAENADQ
jgi:hypothetical protein